MGSEILGQFTLGSDHVSWMKATRTCHYAMGGDPCCSNNFQESIALTSPFAVNVCYFAKLQLLVPLIRHPEWNGCEIYTLRFLYRGNQGYRHFTHYPIQPSNLHVFKW